MFDRQILRLLTAHTLTHTGLSLESFLLLACRCEARFGELEHQVIFISKQSICHSAL